MSSGRLIPIFMDAMPRACLERGITKDVMILIPLKALESILQRRYFRPILRHSINIWNGFKHWCSQSIGEARRSITAVSTGDGVTFRMLMGAVELRDLNVSTYPWDEERMEPISMHHANLFETCSQSALVANGVSISYPATSWNLHMKSFDSDVRWCPRIGSNRRRSLSRPIARRR